MGGVKSRECVHQKLTPSVMASLAPMDWPKTRLLRIVIHLHSTADNILMFLSKTQIAGFD